MSESQSASRSRLELARDEVDRVFGEGSAAAHPQMVLAVMNTAATDWAARLIGGALEDIARPGGQREVLCGREGGAAKSVPQSSLNRT
jgi:hypothetical protein